MNAKSNVPPPPRTTKSRLASAPPDVPPDNLSKAKSEDAGLQDLNMRVSPRIHRRFKLEAHLRGLTMRELFEASFAAYLDKNGGTMEAPRQDLI